MRKVFASLLVVFLLLLLPCRLHADEPVRMCRPNTMVSALLHVAEQQGYLRQENLTVQFTETTNAKISNDALIAGHADAALAVEGPFVYLSLNGQHPLRIVAQGGASPEMVVIARKDSGLATEKDLRGKRVGYLPGTVSYLFLVRLLESLHMTMDDVKGIPLQPQAMPKALQGRMIDAFVMAEPWADQGMKALGDHAVRFRHPEIYRYPTLLVVTHGFAQQFPDRLQRLLRALLKAEEFIKAHPEETIRLMSEAIKLDEAILRKNWKDYDFTVGLDDSILTTMREDARYVIRDDPNFAGKAIPDFSRYIEPKFLREVAPERVRLP